jgi:hypothetical protein
MLSREVCHRFGDRERRASLNFDIRVTCHTLSLNRFGEFFLPFMFDMAGEAARDKILCGIVQRSGMTAET